MGVSKNRGKPPKMDGENNGKTLLKFMIWGAHPFFWKHPYGKFAPLFFVHPLQDGAADPETGHHLGFGCLPVPWSTGGDVVSPEIHRV